MGRSYKQKVHLAGRECGAGSGGRQSPMLPLNEFRLLPWEQRCGECSRRSGVPWGAGSTGVDGVALPQTNKEN